MKYGLPPFAGASEVIRQVPNGDQRIDHGFHNAHNQRIDHGIHSVHDQRIDHGANHGNDNHSAVHGHEHGHGHHGIVYESNMKDMKGETLEFHQIQLGVFESQFPSSPNSEEFVRAKRTFSKYRNQELAVAFIIPLLSYLFAEVCLSELTHVWNYCHFDLRSGSLTLRPKKPEPSLQKDLQADSRNLQRAIRKSRVFDDRNRSFRFQIRA